MWFKLAWRHLATWWWKFPQAGANTIRSYGSHTQTHAHTHKHRHTHTLTHGNAAPALPSPWFKSQRWTLYCKPSVELTSSKRLKALSSSFTKPLRPSKLLLQKNIQAKSFNRKSCKTWTNTTMKKYWYTIFQQKKEKHLCHILIYFFITLTR